jgi:hypothetical protein
MAGGFFGGIAEGIDDARARQLQQQQIDNQMSLGTQRLQLEQQSQQNAQQRDLFARADKDVSNLMATASHTIEALQQQGKDPATISKAIQPIVQAAKRLRQSAGGDPSAIDAQVSVALAKPFIPSQEMAKPTKMGSGPLGEETYGTYNPQKGAYEPIQSAAAPSDIPAQPSGTGYQPPGQNLSDQTIVGIQREPTQLLDSKGNVVGTEPVPTTGQGASGEAFLATVPEKYRAAVKAVGDYEINPATLLARGKPESRLQFLSWVKQYNPSFDQKDFSAANSTLQSFTTKTEAKAVRSFNVLVSHLDTLENMVHALNNKDVNLYNSLKNQWQAQTGSTAPVTFDAIKSIVGDEIVKAVVGGAAALGDREEIKKNISNARSERQLMDIIAKYKELSAGQLDGLRKQYEEGTKRKDFNRFLLPETQKAFERKAQSAAPATSGAVDWQTYFGTK